LVLLSSISLPTDFEYVKELVKIIKGIYPEYSGLVQAVLHKKI
jgi:hypothetical protein